MRRLHHLSWVFCLWLLLPGSVRAQLVPDWDQVHYPPFPLSPATPFMPVLTAADVTDREAVFVADPFLMHEDGGPWHLFFEVERLHPTKAEIGHATSTDGILWQYDQIVLSETFNLSFPYMFKNDGTYYMIVVDPSLTRSVKLYKANNYPYDWVASAELISGRPFADPVIFRYGGIWYLLVGQSSSGNLYLYTSNNLLTGWTEHPMSPVVNDVSMARPAGRPFVFGGRLIRLAQKNDQWYGQAVRAFEVDRISRTTYSEHEIPESPILAASGQGWNRDGMHTCDAWWDHDHWLASVDGIQEWWTIGIYRTETVAGLGAPDVSAESPAGSQRFGLGQNSPNPFCGSTDILVRLAEPRRGPGDWTGPLAVSVYDAGGRRDRVLPIEGSGTSGMVRVTWDGADDMGRPVSAGEYFYRIDPPRTVESTGSGARQMTLVH
jgi:hypothetical protein